MGTARIPSLEVLKTEHVRRVRLWKLNGGKTTNYTCPHCSKKIEVRQPEKDDVGKKGSWDSARTCIECGKVSFVVVHTDGRTQAIKI